MKICFEGPKPGVTRTRELHGDGDDGITAVIAVVLR